MHSSIPSASAMLGAVILLVLATGPFRRRPRWVFGAAAAAMVALAFWLGHQARTANLRLCAERDAELVGGRCFKRGSDVTP